MTHQLLRRGCWSLVGLVMAAACFVDVDAQATQVLGTLTVPTAKLPAGCTLQPVANARTQTLPDGKVILNSAPGQPPRNPWTGTDNAVRMAARQAVEGPPRVAVLPDGPPTSREGIAAWTAKGLADIAEGYQADYASQATTIVRVAAVRYVEARPATTPEPGHLILGATVVRVTGDATSGCYQAIWSHLASLR